ncbi:MAG: 50S ribosomal protein L9 [Clostridiales Family XIII bacterium]|jgi:large subunit ribosomal protein L9|nr:50S ribosomal protein L9 [Clostridiales Family XIII bacterium]
MIVILLKDVKDLGKSGDVVKVSDGYARNMLLPRGMAAQATDGNIRSLEKQKKVLEEQRQRDLQAAQAQAEKIGKLTVEILTKSGESGRLFGSITSKDIADAIKRQHGVDLDKRKILLESPIKTIGETSVEIKLYPEVSATVKVDVKSQGA